MDEGEPTGDGHGAFAELAQTGDLDAGIREAGQSKDHAAAGLPGFVEVAPTDRTEVLDHDAQAGQRLNGFGELVRRESGAVTATADDQAEPVGRAPDGQRVIA